MAGERSMVPRLPVAGATLAVAAAGMLALGPTLRIRPSKTRTT